MYWVERNNDGAGYQLVKDGEEHYGMHGIVHAVDPKIGGLAVKAAFLVKEHKIEGAYTRTPAHKNTLNGEELEEFWRMFYKSV